MTGREHSPTLTPTCPQCPALSYCWTVLLYSAVGGGLAYYIIEPLFHKVEEAELKAQVCKWLCLCGEGGWRQRGHVVPGEGARVPLTWGVLVF